MQNSSFSIQNSFIFNTKFIHFYCKPEPVRVWDLPSRSAAITPQSLSFRIKSIVYSIKFVVCSVKSIIYSIKSITFNDIIQSMMDPPKRRVQCRLFNIKIINSLV